MGIPGDMPLDGAAAAWKKALAEQRFTVVTVFAAYSGESYADIPTVQQTVGFVPPAMRAELQRIGLSATQRPLDLVARLLSGVHDDRPPTVIVDCDQSASSTLLHSLDASK